MSLDNIKIIFFDIDGTLIDINSKKISEGTLAAGDLQESYFV